MDNIKSTIGTKEISNEFLQQSTTYFEWLIPENGLPVGKSVGLNAAEAKANAERIVQCWNEWDNVVEVLKDANKMLTLTQMIHKSVECGKVADKIKMILNRINNPQ